MRRQSGGLKDELWFLGRVWGVGRAVGRFIHGFGLADSARQPSIRFPAKNVMMISSDHYKVKLICRTNEHISEATQRDYLSSVPC